MTEDSQQFEQASDEQLALACNRRPVDQDAYIELYRRYGPVVRRTILSKLRSFPSAPFDDLAQEIFLRLFGALPRYDPARLPLKSFIHVITDRVIIDFLRYGSMERAHTLAIEDHIYVLQLRAAEDPQIVMRTAERLAAQIQDESKIPLVWDLLHGVEPKEVARKHNVKPNQVYAARARLRQILEDLSSELPSTS
ncbi:MAG TPA: sigma-70 family RNA polymerase sigma factor [Bryobacteraceae bacterium]|jgi:RNA polymerase sigma factor (sigma-70 family)